MPIIRVLLLTTVICETSTAVSTETSSPVLAGPAAEIRSKIAQARSLLAKAALGPGWRGDDAVLAVWDGSPENGITLIDVRNGVSRSAGFAVERQEYNGVSPDLRVTEPPGLVVLAGKFHVGHGRTRRTVIYTPYTPGLHTPEMVAAGRDYLDSLLAKAVVELDAGPTASRAVNGRLVTETVDRRVLAAILIVEHARFDRLDDLGLKQVVEEVLVVLAANGDDAYDHAVSRARAQGLAQFIRSSYQLTRRRYPDARIKADFNSGASDHLNVVKAQYCLADWTLSALRPETVDELRLPGFEEDLGAYIAAGYNGGEQRAASAYQRSPVEWEKPGRGLWRETVSYVRNFRMVYRHLFPEPDRRETDATFDP